MSSFMLSSLTSRQQGLSKMQKIGFFACLVFIVLFVGCAPSSTTERVTTSTPTPAPTMASSPKPEKSYEYILASLDKGYPVEEGDVSINRYRYLLDSLEKKTINTRQQIADMTVTMQQSARNKFGKELKLIDILEGSNKVIPAGRKMDYAEVSAMVMVTLAQ